MHHDSFEQWEAEGASDLNSRAITKARQMLKDYEMPKLDEAVDEELLDFIDRRVSELPDLIS